jgi:hypothetical protein
MSPASKLLPLLALALALAALGLGSLPAGDAKKAKFQPIEVDGQLAATDPPDRKLNTPCKLHRVTLAKGRSYVIDMVSKDFDSYLRLEDAAGTQLAEDDDGGGNLNARIVVTPEKDGSYQIAAITLDGNVGNYRLTVRAMPPLKLGKAVDVGPDGLKIDGTLAPTDPLSPARPNHPCQVYSVKMKANQIYVIDLESKQFDAYLNVLDSTMRSLAEDDDGGDGTNARIMFRPRVDGTYHIVATVFDDKTGDYTLKVRRQAE